MANRLVILSYLIPHKISLLTLVAAYCSGIIPQSSTTSLLQFLVKLIGHDTLLDDDPIAVQLPLLELVSSIRSACGQKDGDIIVSRLISALWSLRSLDFFHQFMIKSRSMLVNTSAEGKKLIQDLPEHLLPKRLLVKTSFFGKFVMNCMKDFDSLEFEESHRFWSAFVQYRSHSKALHISLNKPKHIHTSDSRVASKLKKLLPTIVDENVIVVSKYDLSKALSKQIRLYETFGTPVTSDLNDTLEMMTKQGNDLPPSAYYLKYLDCVALCDYEGSFKNLHGYFDYMMSSVSQGYYQYALLSLALLHTKFNSNKQALEAINEAINVARENNDNSCLKFLLFWLFNFLKSRPELNHNFFESSEQLLGSLMSNKNLDNSSEREFNSNAQQIEASQAIIDGGSLSSILESIIKAEYLALSVDYSNSSFIVNCSLQSMIWDRIGEKNLSKLYVEIAKDASKSEKDINNAYLRLAWLKFEENGDIDEVMKYMGENCTSERFSGETQIMRLILRVKHLLETNNIYKAKLVLDQLKQEQSVKRENLDLCNEVFLLELRLMALSGSSHRALQLASDEIKKYESNPVLYNNYWYIRLNLFYCEVMCDTGHHCCIRVLPTVKKMMKLCVESGLLSLKNDLTILLVKILLTMRKREEAYKVLKEAMVNIIQFSGKDVRRVANDLMRDLK